MGYLRLLIAIIGFSSFGTALPVYSSDIEYSAELYALGADVSITGDDFSQTADFDDILDNLELGFFGSFAAKGERLGFIGNILYVGVEAQKSMDNADTSASLKAEVSALVLSAAMGWEFYESPVSNINGVLGVRWLNLDTDFDLTVDSFGEASSGESEDIWNAVIGIQGKSYLSKRWYINYYADIGAGDSGYTWQATTSLGYQFSNLDVILGYQYLEWALEDTLIKELTVSGPAIGIRFNW